jgi:hypothetical protein
MDTIDLSTALEGRVSVDPPSGVGKLSARPSLKDYRFDRHGSLIAFACVIGVWVSIVCVASAINHVWLGSLAIILGLALAPVAVAGSFRPRT